VKGLRFKSPRSYARCEDCGKAFTQCGGRIAEGPIAKVPTARAADPTAVSGVYRYERPPWVCGRTIRKAGAR